MDEATPGVAGSVAELKLRCLGSFVFFEFDPELVYNISERDGRCSLEVVGEPGTTFALIQG